MSDDFIDSLFSEVDEYYPGSKRKRRPAEPVKAKASLDLQDWDTKSYSKTMPNGQDMEMFTIGALALALGRPIITIRDWTKKGYLPSAPYRLPAKPDKNGDTHQGRRLYSRRMIESAIEIFDKAGLLDKVRVEWSNHQQVSQELAETWNKIRVEELEN